MRGAHRRGPGAIAPTWWSTPWADAPSSRAGSRRLAREPVYEEAEDAGFIYYTRHFRARDGRLPAFRAPVTTFVGTFSLLTLPGDNDTWSVTVFISAGDRPLKRLREDQPCVDGACCGMSPACALARGRADYRSAGHGRGARPVPAVPLRWPARRDGRSRRWATRGPATNPSLGRGMSLGLRHVQHLREVIREHLEDPAPVRRGVERRDRGRVDALVSGDGRGGSCPHG